METLLFDPEDVEKSLDMSSAIDAVEDAFEAHATGGSVMPPKSYIDLPEHNGDFRAMPAYVDDSAGLKWVNSHPDNPEEHDLPSVMGVMVYSDPETAYPLAIIDGTSLTRYRTGAAAGVATRYLAHPDSESFGILGAGAQAHTQVDAVTSLSEFGIERVVVHDIDEERAEEFVEDESERDLDVTAGSAEDVAGCDVISTTTPSRQPILERGWIDDGTHINAMGADAEGKQELDPQILKDSKVVVDDWEQCKHSGEVNVPVSEGAIDRSDVHAEIGEVVAGEAPGREGDEITVFDSTGLAIQDVAASRIVYERGKKEDVGTPFSLVGTDTDS